MANHNYLHLVNQGLLGNIEDKKKELTMLQRDLRIPTYKDHKNLQIEAVKHSVEIELVGCTKIRKHKLRRDNLKNLENALVWGSENYKDYITEGLITHLAELIEPNQNFGGYRYGEVRIKTQQGITHGTSPEKIENEMDYFLFENSCIETTPEQAIHAHLHTARIHPFFDGNGRTARLLQNIVLEKKGYFPVIIRNNERTKYIDLIAEAVRSYKKLAAETFTNENRAYQELKAWLAHRQLSIEDLKRCRILTLDLCKQTTSPDTSAFYDYIAQKILDAFNHEVYKVTEKIKMKKGYHSTRKSFKKKASH
ncbi:MAG: Fic family protein [Nanoarchaeota archaeon]